MPAPITLGSMVTSVLRRANLEDLVTETNAVITLPEVREYIGEALAECYDLLVQARGQEWYRKTSILQTNPNQGAYPMPSDVYSVLSVDVFLAPNMVISARPYMESERNMFRWYPGWFYNMPVYFRLLGVPQSTGAAIQPPMINFIPAPASTYTVAINYYPPFRPFATDGSEDDSVFDGVNGWEGYAIWLVVAMCLEKLRQDSTFARAQFAKYTERLEAMAPDRHAGDAERVHDVSADSDGLFTVP